MMCSDVRVVARTSDFFLAGFPANAPNRANTASICKKKKNKKKGGVYTLAHFQDFGRKGRGSRADSRKKRYRLFSSRCAL
jgi:hypothetical protein